MTQYLPPLLTQFCHQFGPAVDLKLTKNIITVELSAMLRNVAKFLADRS